MTLCRLTWGKQTYNLAFVSEGTISNLCGVVLRDVLFGLLMNPFDIGEQITAH